MQLKGKKHIKIFILVVIFLVLFILVYYVSPYYYLIFRYFEKPNIAEIESEAILNEITEEKIAIARKTATFNGIIKDMEGQSIVLERNGEVIEFFLTEKTLYEKGILLDAGSKNDLKIGKMVSIVYNTETFNILNLWYEK